MSEVFKPQLAPVIIGGGLAGLMTALTLAPRPVTLLSKAPLGREASTAWAQGGIAAAIGSDDDPALHLADTLKAGDGLCDAAMAAKILEAGPATIERLVRFGVPFDRDSSGQILRGLEAAHSRRRIVHAGGDATGREIMRALTQLVEATPSITVIKGVAARRLIVEDNRILGVLVNTNCGPVVFETDQVVIATGGIGGLFMHSTNPMGSFGQGLALAARAGASLADLEFIQFHPTALASPASPLKLISEAVRGEGAILIDETGERFMAHVEGAELAPRDIVARAVWRHCEAGHKVYLDARQVLGLDFPRRFPAVTALCLEAGVDPVTQPIPIQAAAHYHMGGIAVDARGRSSIEGLWACGEAAATGLHGANRLASNSLLEAAVCGQWVAEDIAGHVAPRRRARVSAPATPVGSDPAPVRPIVSAAAGVLRSGAGLREAAGKLYPLVQADGAASDPALVGLMIVIAALKQEESRGAHMRTDFPNRSANATRNTLTLSEGLAVAEALMPECVS
jgi:L-aspartate oxidase